MSVPAGDSGLLQIIDAALADAARRAGDWLVCRPGCTQCCYGAFAINQLDAMRLRAGMDALQASEPARAAAVEDRAKRWIDEFGAEFPGDLASGILGDREEDRVAFEGFANDAPCPALDPASGLCDLYEHRPMTCRVFGPPVRVDAGDGAEGLAHCELCFVGATPEQVATCEMDVPLVLEAELLDQAGSSSETVVACALLSPGGAVL